MWNRESHKPEGRIPRAEEPGLLPLCRSSQFALRSSAFLRPSELGLRISFGFRPPAFGLHAAQVFNEEVYPVITPIAVASLARFPLLPGLLVGFTNIYR